MGTDVKASRPRLSPTALNLFKDCPLCFWMDKVRGIRRPRGIYPSLPNGMDRAIKAYFDRYRRQGSLPPEFNVAAFEGVRLFGDQKKLDLWREWKTGLRYEDEDGSVLSGAVDDLMEKDGKILPLDYKTKGSPTTPEDAIRYYQTQLDCYALLLEAKGLKSAGHAYLLYYSPKEVGEKGAVVFHLQAIRIETDPGRARTILREAVECLAGDAPKSKPCEYCAWVRKVRAAGLV